MLEAPAPSQSMLIMVLSSDPTPHPAAGASSSAANSTPSLLPPRPQPQANVYSLPKNVKQENRMLYVMAFEEDGYGRDVTRRYARDYNAKVAKHQGGSNAGNVGGKARQAWWDSVLNLVKRPYQLVCLPNSLSSLVLTHSNRTAMTSRTRSWQRTR